MLVVLSVGSTRADDDGCVDGVCPVPSHFASAAPDADRSHKQPQKHMHPQPAHVRAVVVDDLARQHGHVPRHARRPRHAAARALGDQRDEPLTLQLLRQ